MVWHLQRQVRGRVASLCEGTPSAPGHQNTPHLAWVTGRQAAQVATFYTMFNRTPIGKLHVMVCGTTPCMLCGARGIYQALKQHLGIDYGQTTKVRGVCMVAHGSG